MTGQQVRNDVWKVIVGAGVGTILTGFGAYVTFTRSFAVNIAVVQKQIEEISKQLDKLDQLEGINVHLAVHDQRITALEHVCGVEGKRK